jgi:hypothetical protein
MQINYSKVKDSRHQETKPLQYGRFDFDTIAAMLRFLVRHPQHLERLAKYIIPSYFFKGDDSVHAKGLRMLYSVLLDIKNHGELDMLEEPFFDSRLKMVSDGSPDDRAAAMQIWEHTIGAPEMIAKSENRGCQTIFLDFLKTIAIIQWSEEFMPKYRSGQVAEAVSSMKGLTNTTDHIRYDNIEESIDISALPVDVALDFLAARGSCKDYFLLGCNSLDDDLGGFERRSLSIFIAPTNGGKSMMCQHLIRRCVELQMYCHIAVVEDRPKSFLRRLMASLTGIPTRKLYRLEKDGVATTEKVTVEEKVAFQKAQQNIAKYLKIEFLYGESLEMIHQKKMEYDAQRVAQGLEPYDVDIVDYSGHIADKAMGDKMYEKYRNVFAARKNYALINNKIAFDFAQINREGFKKKESKYSVTHGDLAGGYDLSQVCDNIIAINISPEDREKHEARLTPTKVKDGENSKAHPVKTEFDKARWNMNPAAPVDPGLGSARGQEINLPAENSVL